MQKVFVFLLSTVFCLLYTAVHSQQWHKIGNGIGYAGVTVGTIKVLNDSLYAGGIFGGAAYGGKGNGIVKFNGTSDFDSLGSGIGNGGVNSIEYYNGEIYAGGNNVGAGLWPYIPGTKNLAKWNGVKWDSVPGYFGGIAQVLKVKNDLYLGGDFAGSYYHFVAHYNGTTWDNINGGVNGWPGGIGAMVIYKGDLIVAGGFQNAQGGTVQANHIARWDGTNWYALGSGLNDIAYGLEVDTISNVLYVGGGFTTAGGIPSRGIAKWDGSNWSSVPDFPDTCGPVGNLKIFDRKLFVGAGNCSTKPLDIYLYYLNLSDNTWHPVFGPNHPTGTLEVYKGNLFVGGSFDKIDTTIVNEIACYGDSCPGTPITLTLPFAVHEYEQGLKFNVFPNPAKKEINIQLAEGSEQLAREEKYTARIKNSLGQSIFEQKFEKELRINTSDFKKGIYFVEVCTVEGKLCHSEKIIFQ